jgi:uncharacterized membrane protein
MTRNRNAPTTRNNNQSQSHHVVGIQQSIQHKTIFDPDVIEHYSRLIPDAPERILTVFEKNAEAERNLQLDSLKSQIADNKRRDWMAFAIIICGLAASAFLAWIDKPYLSGTALATIIGYAVIGFLKNK